MAEGFQTAAPTTKTFRGRHSLLLLSARATDDEHDNDLPGGPEPSRILDFIRNYLDDQKNSDDSAPTTSSSDTATTTTTHLIAIPMDACHELALELESVQRAILYHCPVLVHACIAPAVTRLPLLLVQASYSSGGALTSSQRLQRLVQETVEEFLTFEDEGETESEEQRTVVEDEETAAVTGLDAVGRNDGESQSVDDNDEQPDLTSANADGIQPWMVPFQGLEIEGFQNQVLYTAAVPDSAGTRKLQAFVQALRDRIHETTGWSTLLPVDHIKTSQVQLSKQKQQQVDSVFRPRIPFMRLPRDWDEIVRREQKATKETAADDNDAHSSATDDDDMTMLTSDQGGNGISPIFWGQWMDDRFGEETRLREVAIYRRSSSSRKDTDDSSCFEPEQAFYLPDLSVPLPAGNAFLTKIEGDFQEYQERRMMEAEDMLEAEKSTDSNRVVGETVVSRQDEDLLMTKTRERLEGFYSQQHAEIDAKVTPDDEDGDAIVIEMSDVKEGRGSVDKDLKEDEEEDDDFDWRMTARVESPADPNAIDDWTRQRIQQAIASRARVQSEQELARKKDKPPVAENPVFQKYKDGTLVPKQPAPAPPRELPPFPSREHCSGFWRVMSSPTGFAVEEGDQSRSDNLVLRVDGTTAGGPILDQETRQKASGGTWRMTTGDTIEDTRLRIRLVIPPKKERILVMEGRLEKVSMSSEYPLTSSTFGIPALEELAAGVATEMEDLLYCGGSVWVEDARTGRNRDEIGKFSLMKLNVPTDPSQFTITIPRPVRNQD